MTISQLLLAYLKSNKANYKELRKLLHGQGDAGENFEDQSIRNTLSRLKKRGLLSYENGEWNITQKGKIFNDKQEQPLRFFKRVREKSKEQKVICMFDIPEDNRYKRDWLRAQLELLDFTLLQQSVWIGPAPIPKDFVMYLKTIHILEHIRFLEVTNDNLIKRKNKYCTHLSRPLKVSINLLKDYDIIFTYEIIRISRTSRSRIFITHAADSRSWRIKG
ncbi:MAG: hypothetical protein KBC22_00115 [Candidatus Pacebacteria bacterium]|nr:hypothetical protein [Candidatus Paceibacterota bacterium]